MSTTRWYMNNRIVFSIAGVAVIFSALGVASMWDAGDYTYIDEAQPLKKQRIVEVGSCTPQQVAWDRTIRSQCAVKMDDGTVKIVPGPVMVGLQLITCPEKTNNIDNERCVYWAGSRPKVIAK